MPTINTASSSKGRFGAAGAGGVVIALPEREKRKVVYDEKEYYRAVMGVEQGTHKGRPPGPPLMRGGLASRFWTTFESKWIEEAGGKVVLK